MLWYELHYFLIIFIVNEWSCHRHTPPGLSHSALSSRPHHSPKVSLPSCSHEAVVNSQQLLQYLATHPNTMLAELGPITESDLSTLRLSLKQQPIDKQRVSSFLTTSDNVNRLKEALALKNAEVKKIQLAEVVTLLEGQTKPIVILADLAPVSAPRLLQGNFTQNVTSKIFLNMGTSSLSGLWVGLFLLVMLGIAISCLFDLKTHDKFARQNLWVGRESWFTINVHLSLKGIYHKGRDICMNGSEIEGGRVRIWHFKTILEHELCKGVHRVFGERVKQLCNTLWEYGHQVNVKVFSEGQRFLV